MHVHPRDISANAGQTVVLIVFALGETPISYQWFKDGAPLDGKTELALVLTSLQPSDAGSYHCEATNAGGTTPSDTGTLVVFDPRRPNAARFLSATIPATVAAGAEILVGITMRNDSDVSWTASQGYALAVTDDPGGLLSARGGKIPDASRLYIYDETAVAEPNTGQFQFVAQIHASVVPGDYAFKVRMVEEFVEFFGEEKTLTVKVIPPANAAPDWAVYE